MFEKNKVIVIIVSFCEFLLFFGCRITTQKWDHEFNAEERKEEEQHGESNDKTGAPSRIGCDAD